MADNAGPEELLWPPNEMADLMDAMARSADRCTLSYSEAAHLARNAAKTIRHLDSRHAQRVTGASDVVDEAACLIWAELCPGMVMGDEDRQHYENAAKAVLALTSGNESAAQCAPDTKLKLFLSILQSAGGETSGNDDKWNWINYFCDDAEPLDTFNQASKRKLTRVTHDSDSDNSIVYLTDTGRAFIAEDSAVTSTDDCHK